MEVTGQLQVAAALFPGGRTTGTHWKGGWVGHSRLGSGGEGKNSQHFPRRELNSGRTACSLVCILT